MPTPDNCGQAFPCLDTPGDGTIYCRDGGMTLRDWFAGQALAGLLAHVSGEDPYKAPGVAYALADAMLKAREGGDA